MENLLDIIFKIRCFTRDYRQTQDIKSIDYFFLSMLEISTDLVELGMKRDRHITFEEEENWFKGAYHLDFWDSEINNKLYIPMIDKVKEQNYFRKKK